MSLVAEYEATSPKLFLGPTLEAHPTLEVDLERQYALDPDRPISFCWMQRHGLDVESLEATLSRDGTISEFDRLELSEEDDRVLYRLVRSDQDVLGVYRWWVSAGAELLDGRGVDGGWKVRMRFPDRNSFADFHEFLEDGGVSFDLHRLSEGVTMDRDDVLTPLQREALRVAYETGFFDVPRKSTLADLAARLGVSDQAVSERLRRGQGRLIEQYVL